MSHTRVKICGVTRLEDALDAARAGADAIGIVLYERAPRYVAPDRAREILAALPPFVTPVGLFVDATAEEVRRTAGELHLSHVQLHGGESPDVVANLAEFVVLKAIKVTPWLNEALATWREAIAARRLHHLRAFVLESAGPGVGGTGVENDWAAIARAVRAGNFGNTSVIAAGGLTPQNVGDVVRQLRPWAVDVSSGVEGTTAGEKSIDKICAFIRNVRAADRDCG